MKNVVVLRNHLFEQLNRLAEAGSEEEINLEVTRAASIVQVSEAIIKSAQVENQFVAITKGTGSGFIPLANDPNNERLDRQKMSIRTFDVDKEKNWLTGDPGNPAPLQKEKNPTPDNDQEETD